jgi:hypothetical protein
VKPYIRVQAWLKGEDGSDISFDFRGRLEVIGDHITLTSHLLSYAELEAIPLHSYEPMSTSGLELKMTQTGWKFRRGKPEEAA